MPRASPPGPAPGETMRDPLTPPPADYLDHAAARRIVVGVLPRAIHARADPRPRASGPRRRRPDAIGANHHRRRRLAARPAALSGLYVVDLHRVDRGRPDPRRLHSRASALVLDLLVQLAALRACLSAHSQRAAAAAAARSPAQARPAGRV